MKTAETPVSTRTKRTKSAASAKDEKPTKTEKPSSKHHVAIGAAVKDKLDGGRITKHNRMLTLLRRRDGATITEMIEASGWQQHSVRGYLAGTIKKKLGLALTSSKAAGELRRYRIDTQRSR